MTTRKNSDSRLSGQVEDNLRRIYRETAEEQVPDRLLQLVEQLRAKAKTAKDGGNGDDDGDSN